MDLGSADRVRQLLKTTREHKHGDLPYVKMLPKEAALVEAPLRREAGAVVPLAADGLDASLAEVKRLEQLIKATEELERLQRGRQAFYANCGRLEKEKEERKKAEKELPEGERLVLEPLHRPDGAPPPS